jgi:Ca2+/Na+ antiporter
LGIAAVIKPVDVDVMILKQDFPVMFLFTMLLFFMAYGIQGPGRISRKSGILLLSMFVAYQILVWVTAGRVAPEVTG